jgi:hypothetical protein
LPDWLGVDAIGHATAQAAARDGSGYIGHAPETLLTRSFAAGRGCWSSTASVGVRHESPARRSSGPRRRPPVGQRSALSNGCGGP